MAANDGSTRIMIPVADFEAINQQLGTIAAKLDVLFLLYATGDPESLTKGATSSMLAELQQQVRALEERLEQHAGERII